MLFKLTLSILLIIGGATFCAAQTPETTTDKTDSHADKTSTMATVYLYRFITRQQPPKNKIAIYSDGEQLGQIASGRFVMTLLDPGTHFFNTQTGRENALQLDLKRGEKYYLRLNENPGPRLAVVTTDKGAAEVRQLTPVESSDLKTKTKETLANPQ
jgi:hypothetical protein